MLYAKRTVHASATCTQLIVHDTGRVVIAETCLGGQPTAMAAFLGCRRTLSPEGPYISFYLYNKSIDDDDDDDNKSIEQLEKD
jgi:hypothetical protein